LRKNLWGTISYGQNLVFKELRSLYRGHPVPKWNGASAAYTVTASTMIALLACGPQGQMSHAVVEKREITWADESFE
jgi:hypothetical protein